MHALKSSANGTEQHQVISTFSLHRALTLLDVHADTEAYCVFPAIRTYFTKLCSLAKQTNSAYMIYVHLATFSATVYITNLH